MDLSFREAGVSPQITLGLDADHSVDALKPTLRAIGGEQRPLSFELEFDLSWEDWLLVERVGAFSLAERERGPVFGGALKPGQSVRLRTRLAEHLLPLLAESEDIFEAGGRVLLSQPGDPQDGALRRAQAWIAEAVTQELLPGLRGGFQLLDG